VQHAGGLQNVQKHFLSATSWAVKVLLGTASQHKKITHTGHG
jgi:hypothetical protein